jgi:hypothetical protein
LKVKEVEIQKAITDWLSANNYTFWRNFVGPRIAKGKFFIKNPMAGLPDILGILKNYPGKLFGIEIKSDSGKLSEDQKAWIRKLELSGATILVTRDLETMVNWMRDQENVSENQ